MRFLAAPRPPHETTTALDGSLAHGSVARNPAAARTGVGRGLLLVAGGWSLVPALLLLASLA
jgi:hypothetical protein